MIPIRAAVARDIDSLRDLILIHGENSWNYLPIDGVEQELADIISGRALAVAAEKDRKIVGVAIGYCSFNRFPEWSLLSGDSAVGYVGDIAVHRQFVGQGIGTNMLLFLRDHLVGLGMTEIFIDCHEENLASRGMIRKAGFEFQALVDDSLRRKSGSRKTVISCWRTETLVS